jgi:DNA-binding beta-propeller fold protein YncE
MRMKIPITMRIALLIVAAAVFMAADKPAANYKVVASWKLGGDGGWDYLNADSDNHRLFIARATRVMVVDTDAGKLLTEIPDTPGVHGVALVPAIGQGFSSNGREDMISVFDLKSLKVLKKIKVGTGPDAIIYDPFSKRVFTFNAKSHDTTAVDASKGEVAGTLELGGKPEYAVSDEKGTMFVNIEDKSELVAFDPQKLAVKSRWKLTGCEEPTGLAFDGKNRRLFAGCGNKVMAIVDADNGKVLATPAIGDGCDGTAFDADLGNAFATAHDGTLTVIHEDNPNTFTPVQKVATQQGARTVTLDAKTHKVFTVTAKVLPERKVEPDTFVVLVVAPEK